MPRSWRKRPSAFPSSSASFKRRWMSAFPFISWSQKVTAYRASGNSPMPPGNRPSTAKCWAGRIPRTSTPRSTPRTSGPRCKPSPRGFRPGAWRCWPIPSRARRGTGGWTKWTASMVSPPPSSPWSPGCGVTWRSSFRRAPGPRCPPSSAGCISPPP